MPFHEHATFFYFYFRRFVQLDAVSQMYRIRNSKKYCPVVLYFFKKYRSERTKIVTV